jgi:hypothetical protein
MRGGIEQKQIRLPHDRLPDFRVDTIPGAGQYVFEEQPSAVVAVIRQVGLTRTASAKSHN